MYDISYRIAAFKDILPIYIYLHAGTLKSAKIINPLLKDGDIIAISELMGKDIAKILKPNEAEDFLCICKDSIESLDL